MNAYLIVYLNQFAVGKCVVSARTEDQAKDKALDYLSLSESCILAVKLIAQFAE